MECNKDDALRAKEIAEKKFMAKDIAGAKKFAMKAQTLYPGLESISQMLAVLDVYISAERKVKGEVDWYGVLGVNPLADQETVRKHYRKLAIMLHPDKNKSIGAEGAFKIISEAWSFVSDKVRRSAYDKKRNWGVFQHKGQPPPGGSSAPMGQNGFYNFAQNTASHARVPNGNTSKEGASSVPASRKPERSTFWTGCRRCKIQYEYMRMYLNHNLMCPNCHEPFLAVETKPPPSGGSKVTNKTNYARQRQNLNQQRGASGSSKPNVGSAGFSLSDSSNKANSKWSPFSGNADAASPYQAAGLVKQAYEQVKREREEAQAATKREEALRRKTNASKRMGVGFQTGVASSSTLSGAKQGTLEQGWMSETNEPSRTKDDTSAGVKYLLIEKARTEIRKKLNEWNSATVAKSSDKGEENVNEKMTDKDYDEDNIVVNGPTEDENKFEELSDARNITPIYCITSTTSNNGDKVPIEPMLIEVPDSDFHDFNRERTERCFGENQVWAAYDVYDGMPRCYAIVHNVISLDPFEIRISWLKSKNNYELGPLNGVGSAFSKTWGDFRICQREINNSIESFSHKVTWTKGTDGAVQIFPSRGDVWALYRNWSPEWDELTADEVLHKYDMVEVLEDYDEDPNVTVIPLVKVAGFKAVFHRHLNPREIRRIPTEEMFRFSHQTPSFLLMGQEAPNAPRGCRELDPAAIPLELLVVIPDSKEDEIIENDEKVCKENGVDIVEKTDM